MADTDNPDTPMTSPRAAHFGQEPERKIPHRERGHSGQHTGRSGGIGQFLHDVRAELKRVSWPTLQHVQNSTLITLVAVAFFAAYLFGIDQALGRGIIPAIEWVIDKIVRLLGLA